MLLNNKSNRLPTANVAGRRTARPRSVQCLAQQTKDNAVQQHIAAASLVAASCICAPIAQAAQDTAQLAGVDTSAVTFAVGGSAAIAGLGAMLVATDPQKRWESCDVYKIVIVSYCQFERLMGLSQVRSEGRPCQFSATDHPSCAGD